MLTESVLNRKWPPSVYPPSSIQRRNEALTIFFFINIFLLVFCVWTSSAGPTERSSAFSRNTRTMSFVRRISTRRRRLYRWVLDAICFCFPFLPLTTTMPAIFRFFVRKRSFATQMSFTLACKMLGLPVESTWQGKVLLRSILERLLAQQPAQTHEVMSEHWQTLPNSTKSLTMVS